jgi:Skp family chaperone for outer membrane proteins
MAIGAVTARIITQYSDKGSKAAARDINKLGKNFDKFAGKVGKAFGLAAAASAAFAVKIGVDSVKAAIADEKSQALLANSLKTPQEQQTQRSQQQKPTLIRFREHSESSMTNCVRR